MQQEVNKYVSRIRKLYISMHKNRLQNSESNEAAKYRKENATQVNAFISATTRNNRFQMQWQNFPALPQYDYDRKLMPVFNKGFMLYICKRHRLFMHIYA